MSEKYDIESFINQVITTIKDNLSAKVNEINSEKFDTIRIENIPGEAFFDDVNQQVFNKDSFIYYTIVNIDTETVGGTTKMEVTLAVSVILSDTGETGMLSKMLRYSRCLREIIQSNFKKSASTSPLRISEFVPADVELSQGGGFKISGIQIKTFITG